MLEIKKITKVYQTEGFKQKALDGVSINFRKCEFASILGPSGSGKTTLLNIIGGLDHYDSGDLIINIWLNKAGTHFEQASLVSIYKGKLTLPPFFSNFNGISLYISFVS